MYLRNKRISSYWISNLKARLKLYAKIIKFNITRGNSTVLSNYHTYTYHSRFIPGGVAEASQTILRNVDVLSKLLLLLLLPMSNTADVTGGKPIAVWSQSISGVNAINPLVAFYDIHGRKREVLFIYFVPDTTRDHT
jgi:hypothetical protein